MHEITELLKAWSNGDKAALDQLVPLVDGELRKIAHAYMRKERREHILQTTALVHEALIKLIKENVTWENRRQFYAFVAKRMRQVLADYARRRPEIEPIDVEETVIPDEKSKELRLLHEALTKLATIDERKVTIVECHFFIGLTMAEVAELLGLSKTKVERDWKFTRTWLKREMSVLQ